MLDVEQLKNHQQEVPTNVLSILVENKPGVLSRIDGLISRRSYNIESLTVSTTHNDLISRVSIVVKGDPKLVRQIVGQLSKLINVIHIEILNSENAIESEIVFAKVDIEGVDKNSTPYQTSLIELATAFGAKVIDICDNSMIIKASGTVKKMNSLIHELKQYKLLEVVRSGSTVISRGHTSIFGELENA